MMDRVWKEKQPAITNHHRRRQREQQPLLSFFNLKSSPPRLRTTRRINKLTLYLFAFRYIEIVKIRDKFWLDFLLCSSKL